MGDLLAGNGGIKTEVAQFFAKVKTRDEVLEYAGAFLQLYREEGWYLERTVHFVARVGLDYVKKRIIDDAAGRRALWEQFAIRARRRTRPVARARARTNRQTTVRDDCGVKNESETMFASRAARKTQRTE
jgi:NAD(P)H-nitrite reductase large subunit